MSVFEYERRGEIAVLAHLVDLGDQLRHRRVLPMSACHQSSVFAGRLHHLRLDDRLSFLERQVMVLGKFFQMLDPGGNLRPLFLLRL